MAPSWPSSSPSSCKPFTLSASSAWVDTRAFTFTMSRMRKALVLLIGMVSLGFASVQAADDGWKKLPLVKDGKVDPSWALIGYGGFAAEDGMLRTDPAPEGLGL